MLRRTKEPEMGDELINNGPQMNTDAHGFHAAEASFCFHTLRASAARCSVITRTRGKTRDRTLRSECLVRCAFPRGSGDGAGRIDRYIYAGADICIAYLRSSPTSSSARQANRSIIGKARSMRNLIILFVHVIARTHRSRGRDEAVQFHLGLCANFSNGRSNLEAASKVPIR